MGPDGLAHVLAITHGTSLPFRITIPELTLTNFPSCRKKFTEPRFLLYITIPEISHACQKKSEEHLSSITCPVLKTTPPPDITPSFRFQGDPNPRPTLSFLRSKIHSSIDHCFFSQMQRFYRVGVNLTTVSVVCMLYVLIASIYSPT